MEAGLTRTLARCARRGGDLPSASMTRNVTASRGSLARTKAASISGGRPCASDGNTASASKQPAMRRCRGMRGLSGPSIMASLPESASLLKLLAFDTSTETLSIAVRHGAADSHEPLVYQGAGGAQASAALIPAINDLLARAGLRLA